VIDVDLPDRAPDTDWLAHWIGPPFATVFP
jgi:hypothetical protein